MKTKLTLLVLAVVTLCTNYAFSQKIILEVGSEYATYNMSMLKGFQSELFDNTPVRGKHVRSFPAFFGFGGKMMLAVKRFQFGVVAGINSTGARSSYEDYSGEIRFDQLVKMKHIGAVCNFRLAPESSDREFFFVLQTERIATDYSLNGVIRVGDEESDETLEFKSKSFCIRPGIRYSYTFFERIVASAELGYALDMGGDLIYTKDQNLRLINARNEPVGANWSGVRFGICMAVKL